MYEGHEVAAHTINHPSLPKLTDEEITEQVENDRLALSELVVMRWSDLLTPEGE